MSKTIPVETVKSLNGKPMRVQAKDADGETVWKEQPDLATRKPGIPEMTDADTRDVLKIVILNIPRTIQTGNDPLRVTQVFHRIDIADGTIELHDKHYEWLHRLLRREIPLVAEEKQMADVKPLPYGQWLWGVQAPVVIEQLKEPGERKNLDDLDLD